MNRSEITARVAATDWQRSLNLHLAETIGWIKRAQDAQTDGGVSAVYTPWKGWQSSYPETTGYIIPTMLNQSVFADDSDCFKRSFRMADWLLKVQLRNGAFPGGAISRPNGPSVFNTGQILFGLIRAYQVSARQPYLEAAIRAGDWLVSVQRANGEWTDFDFLGKSHAYNTRTAWSLLLLDGEKEGRGYRSAAIANLRWAETMVQPDGFIDRCAFDPLRPGEQYGLLKKLKVALREKNRSAFLTYASLHTIAYTIQGLLECAWMLGDRQMEEAALRSCDALATRIRGSSLYGFYAPDWQPVTRSRCLTGLAQMAIVWLRLYERGRQQYLDCAEAAIEELQSVQNLSSRNEGVRGALAGSSPVYGLYLPFRYPNWAAKFAADALHLMLCVAGSPEKLSQLRIW